MVIHGEERLREREDSQDPEEARCDSGDPETPAPSEVLANVATDDRREMRTVSDAEGIDTHIQTAFVLTKQVADLLDVSE